MMKKMMFLSMAMSALLLVGCGAQDQQAPQAESSTPASVVMTMEELKAKNTLEEVLKQHTSMSYITSYKDESDTIWGETMGQFTMKDGQLLYERTSTQYDAIAEYADGYEAQDVPGAFYLTDGYSKLLFLYPEGAYEARMAQDWSYAAGFETEDTLNLASSEIVEDDIVMKLQGVSANGGSFSETTYYANAESGLIHTIEVTVIDGSGSLYGSTVTKVVYGDPYTTSDVAYNAIAGAEDAVELTVVFNPGAEEYTQVLKAAPDTRVVLPGMVYSDAELTEELEAVDLTGGSTTVYVVVD